MSGGIAALGGQLWLPLLLLVMQVPVVALSSRLYERETSATFSALRDAVPEHVPAAVAPVTGEAEPLVTAQPQRAAEVVGPG